jgi:DNA end-binding protein Ku
VTIPVSLRPAVEERDLKFTMLDKKNLSPVGYKHVNKRSGAAVKWADIVKGYEYAEDKYVVLGPKDFEKANVKANKLLEIEDFVSLDEVDATYLEKPYYIVPTAQGRKAYNLLRDALAHTRKIGIGRVVLHTKYRLVAVLPQDDILLLEILRFPHELRPRKDLEMPATKGSKVDPREVAMAEQIIAGMTSRWNPNKYKDTYHDDLLRLIRKKVKAGATAEIEPYNEPDEDLKDKKGKILDLMPLLQASLERGSKKRRTARRTATKKTAPRKRAAGHRS